MYWTLQNLKDSENKQKILHCSSIFTAGTVHVCRAFDTSKRGVLILPGLGNSAKDYEALSGALHAQGLHPEIVPIVRVDWLRNAAGLRDVAYWKGTLQPRPTVDWYLLRVCS
jgi:hypothetical protein